MITLAFGQMFFFFAISWPAYGGEDGLPIYVRSGFPGLNTLAPIQFFAICYILLMAAIFLVWRLGGSRFGLALQAARQNRQRLSAVGIRPFGVLLVAFAISGAITGLAGALFADLNRFVSPSMLSWQTSGEILIFVILGGVGRAVRPTRRGRVVHPDGTQSGRRQRLLAVVPWRTAAGRSAVRARRDSRRAGEGWPWLTRCCP